MDSAVSLPSVVACPHATHPAIVLLPRVLDPSARGHTSTGARPQCAGAHQHGCSTPVRGGTPARVLDPSARGHTSTGARPQCAGAHQHGCSTPVRGGTPARVLDPSARGH
ncbi:unnamed protein product [Closterium sp. Naga37s-1]|nr:unnamed protein product [Closterium sp. Naga37s-1]